MISPYKQTFSTAIILLAFSLAVYSQDPADTVKVRALNIKCNRLHSKATDSIIIYAQQGYALATKIGDIKGTGQMLAQMGYHYKSKGQKNLAIAKLKEANGFYTAINYKDGYASNIGDLGRIYASLGEYPTAIDLLMQAIRHSDSTHNHASATAYFNILGFIYLGLQKEQEALQHFQIAHDRSVKANIPAHTSGILINMGSIYRNLDSLQLSLKILNRALHLIDSLNDLGTKFSCYRELSYLMIDLKQLDSALFYGNAALELGRTVGFPTSEPYTLKALAQVYSAKKNPSTSRILYLKAVSLAEGFRQNSLLIDLYKTLAKEEMEWGLLSESLRHFQQYDSLRNIIFSKESEEKTTNLRIAFDIERNEREIELLKKNREIHKLNRQMLIIAIGAIVTILGLIIAWQHFKIKRESLLRGQQQLLHLANKKLLEAKLQNKDLKEKELEKELGFREKELSSHVHNLVQKNELLEYVKDKLKYLNKTTLPEKSPRIQELIRSIQSSFRQDKEWEGFMEHYMKVKNDFFNQLNTRFPDLTNNDQRLCSLIKLNLETKQIASILGISPESVKVSKHRLRKRLGLDIDQSLSAFLEGIELNTLKGHQAA